MTNDLVEIDNLYMKNNSVINEKDNWANNALILASQYGTTTTLEKIINTGIDINSTSGQS